MDRGGGLTFAVAAVPFIAAITAMVYGVPAALESSLAVLPELLVAPIALLAVRFARHRALAAATLMVALHRLPWPPPPAATLALAVSFHLAALAAIPDGRLARPGAFLHTLLAAATVPVLWIWWPRIAAWPHAAKLSDPAWAVGALAVATVVSAAMIMVRRGPVEAAVPWLIGTVAAVAFGGLGDMSRSLVVSAAQATLIVALVEDGHRLAFWDRLTALPNRRAFDDHMRRLRGRYALAMADVDNFKSFNDRWGHDAGDQALRMVAAEIAKVGGDSRAYRYGGEEFAIVFPDSGARQVVEHLEAVRTAIAQRGFIVRSPNRARKASRRSRKGGPGRRVEITVSFGVASPDLRRPDPTSVLRAADRALYRAKRSGRNRVAVT